MLYRNPESPLGRRSFLERARGLVRRWSTARRRRLTQIDLMSMNPHLKADLGLHDADLRSF